MKAVKVRKPVANVLMDHVKTAPIIMALIAVLKIAIAMRNHLGIARVEVVHILAYMTIAVVQLLQKQK